MLRRDIEIYIASLQRPIDKGGAKGMGRDGCEHDVPDGIRDLLRITQDCS